MGCSILGLITSIAAYIAIYISDDIKSVANEITGSLFADAALLFLLLVPITFLLALVTVAKVEKGIISNVSKLFWDSKKTKIYLMAHTAIPLIILFSIAFYSADAMIYFYLQAPIFIGLLADFLRQFLLFTGKLSVPTEALQLMNERAKEEVNQGNIAEFVYWLNALGGTASRGIDRGDSILAVEAIKKETESINYFCTEMAIHFMEGDPEEEKATYALVSYIQDMEQLYFNALEIESDRAASQILTSLGHNILLLSRRVPSKSALPLHLFGQLISCSTQDESINLSIKGTYTLTSVIKELIISAPVEHLSDQLIPILGHMEEIAQEMFRQNKEIDLEFLQQPFVMILKEFDNQKFKDRKEIEPVLKQLNKILADFSSLGLVVQKMGKEQKR